MSWDTTCERLRRAEVTCSQVNDSPPSFNRYGTPTEYGLVAPVDHWLYCRENVARMEAFSCQRPSRRKPRRMIISGGGHEQDSWTASYNHILREHCNLQHCSDIQIIYTPTLSQFVLNAELLQRYSLTGAWSDSELMTMDPQLTRHSTDVDTHTVRWAIQSEIHCTRDRKQKASMTWGGQIDEFGESREEIAIMLLRIRIHSSKHSVYNAATHTSIIPKLSETRGRATRMIP